MLPGIPGVARPRDGAELRCHASAARGCDPDTSLDRYDVGHDIGAMLGTTSLQLARSMYIIVEGSLEVKLPTIWTDEKQSRAEAERRERLEERRSEEKESEERRCRCAKR